MWTTVWGKSLSLHDPIVGYDIESAEEDGRQGFKGSLLVAGDLRERVLESFWWLLHRVSGFNIEPTKSNLALIRADPSLLRLIDPGDFAITEGRDYWGDPGRLLFSMVRFS